MWNMNSANGKRKIAARKTRCPTRSETENSFLARQPLISLRIPAQSCREDSHWIVPGIDP